MIESRAVTIKVGSSSYHSINDLGLYIGNYDCVGSPNVESHIITVPGRDGYLDLSESIAGRPIYTDREINIEFGSLKTPAQWPAQISSIYKLFHGKTVQLIFDDDPNYYYEGRAQVVDFAFFRQFGSFKLTVKAQPYKYGVDIQPNLSNLSVTSSYQYFYIYVTGQPVSPTFTLAGTGDATVTMAKYSTGDAFSKTISAGTYRWPDVWFTQDTRIRYRANTTGATGTLTVSYRQALI